MKQFFFYSVFKVISLGGVYYENWKIKRIISAYFAIIYTEKLLEQEKKLCEVYGKDVPVPKLRIKDEPRSETSVKAAKDKIKALRLKQNNRRITTREIATRLNLSNIIKIYFINRDIRIYIRMHKRVNISFKNSDCKITVYQLAPNFLYTKNTRTRFPQPSS